MEKWQVRHVPETQWLWYTVSPTGEIRVHNYDWRAAYDHAYSRAHRALHEVP